MDGIANHARKPEHQDELVPGHPSLIFSPMSPPMRDKSAEMDGKVMTLPIVLSLRGAPFLIAG